MTLDIRIVPREERVHHAGPKILGDQETRFSIIMPERYVLQKQREEMERQRVAYATQRELAHQSADHPTWGDVAVMPKDERQAVVTDPGNSSTANPLMYVRRRPGHRPLVVVGMGAVPWQDLKEMADEEDHYNPTMPEKQYHVDWNDIWHAKVDYWNRQKAGRRTYGAHPKR